MKIILFDGICNLCNASVDFIIRNDKNDVFKFASQQSEIGQKLLRKNQLEHHELGTIVLVDDDKIYLKSEAIFRISSYLKGFPELLMIFGILPKPFTDFVYEWIAKNRYHWFGRKETCRLPPPEERAKFR